MSGRASSRALGAGSPLAPEVRCLQRPSGRVRPICHCRAFATSPVHATKNRDAMWSWLFGVGRNFLRPSPDGANYLTLYGREGEYLPHRQKRRQKRDEVDDDPGNAESALEGEQREAEQPSDGKEALRPFPLNPDFVSQSVLSEPLREEIWRLVKHEKKTVRELSVEFHITMERIAAVYRLKEVEKRWIAENKRLSTDFSAGVLAMLPQTHLAVPQPRHEPINDLPVHRSTKPQLFEPVAESRHYTREDAAYAFDPDLPTADARIPHPGMILAEKDRLVAIPKQERADRAKARQIAEERRKAEAIERKAETERQRTRVLRAEGKNRWEWRIQDVKVDYVGPTGRSPGTVGKRYGIPHEDRKLGQIKLPTRIL